MGNVLKYPVLGAGVLADVGASLAPVGPDADFRQDFDNATDIKLINNNGRYDIGVANDGDFELVFDLSSSVIVNLLSERRLSQDENSNPISRSGYFANEFTDQNQIKTGSKVWSYLNTRQNQQSAIDLQRETLSALSWVVSENYASAVDVGVQALDNSTTQINVEITDNANRKSVIPIIAA